MLFTGHILKKKKVKDCNDIIVNVKSFDEDNPEEIDIFLRDDIDIVYPDLVRKYDIVAISLKKDEEEDYYVRDGNDTSPIIHPGNSYEYVMLMIGDLLRKPFKRLGLNVKNVESFKYSIVNSIKKFVDGKDYKITEWLMIESSNFVNDYDGSGVNLIVSQLEYKNMKPSICKNIVSDLFRKWYDNHNMRLFKLIGIEREFIDNHLRVYGFNEVYHRILSFPYGIGYIPFNICNDIVNRFKISIEYNENKIQDIHIFISTLLIKHKNTFTFRYDDKFIDNVHDKKSFIERLGGEDIVQKFNIIMFDEFFTIDVIFDAFKNMKNCIEKIAAYPIDDIQETTDDIEDDEDDKDDNEDEHQKLALETILKNRISCIYGGAGTGKTTTIGKAIAMFAKKTYKIVHLVSYTGKAVSRINEVLSKINTKNMCNTIHKYLSTGPTLHGPRTKELTKLEEKLKKQPVAAIIIDESSMVDLHLFTKFLEIVHKRFINSTSMPRIILVGDPNQLQPIGFGSPFISILKIYPSVKLQTNHRSDSILNKFLFAITEQNRFPKLPNGDFNLEMHFNSNEYFVRKMIQKLKDEGIDHNNITVISPYNKWIENFNTVIKEIFLNDSDTPRVMRQMENNQVVKIYKNHRFMMTSNNYDINLMNGEEGYVTLRDGRPFLTVPGHSINYEIKFLNENNINEKIIAANELTESWTITAHKSQGSEWDYVIVYIDKCSEFISRELLYTAMSRAKIKLIFITNVSYKQMHKHMLYQFNKFEKKKKEIELLEII